jgi:hypothetical protein
MRQKFSYFSAIGEPASSLPRHLALCDRRHPRDWFFFALRFSRIRIGNLHIVRRIVECFELLMLLHGS